jgi:serine/threonine protein kinase/formylglycine-generating enzyme required for sulfatase activity
MGGQPDKAADIFNAAVELGTATERAAYLDAACSQDAQLRAEVEELLAHDQAAGSFLNLSARPDLHATVDEPAVAEGPGMVIGSYKLLEQIGEGGFGVVFMAEQMQPVRRRVALKVLKPGMDTRQVIARFEAERQALALMDHPNIAKVLDGGQTSSDRPYFVMDLVKGLAITDYCDQAQLTARERLELFVRLCQAVQHAHQKGVIHRDLKPSNVLVTLQDGTPLVKVIDFGIAKALGQQLTDKTLFTGFAQMIGTPLYMSPEQAALSNADVDTRSDIYSLGVLLYELLTGTTPFDRDRLKEVGYDELRRIIREEEPPRPSARISTLGKAALTVATQRKSDPKRLSQLCRGELDWIVMRALEKDRNRRYETASAFAADVQRYLNDEPVLACPPSGWYRLRKWARRRPTLAALLGVVLLGLATLAVLSGLLIVLSGNLVAARNDADKKRKAAEKEADKAMKARDFLVSIFRIKDIQAGNTTTARQILNQAEQRIPIEFAEQPELRDELLAAIADVNRTLDRTVPAAMILEARGTVQLHSPRGDSARPVPQTLLYPDDRLSLAADAQVKLVFLSDLHKERLQAGREATIGRKGCAPADAVRERAEDVLMTFVRLRKGTFYMGAHLTPFPPKETEIKEDFEIAVHDVTQGQWEAVMGNNPSWFSRKGNGRNDVVDISDEELKLFPVEQVSWNEAQAFLKKLNEKERGRGYFYRLPTEAEWEYACRGGATSLEECSYYFYFDKPTNDLSSKQANFAGDHPFGKADMGPNLKRPTRVGVYPSNKLGLCDMHGNVWQWTDTPEGSDHRVYRGGAWDNGATGCQAGLRYYCLQVLRSFNLGFRLARVPVQ